MNVTEMIDIDETREWLTGAGKVAEGRRDWSGIEVVRKAHRLVDALDLFAGEVEKLTARAERAEAAIQRVLDALFNRESLPGGREYIPIAAIRAALDSTDPIEVAPKKPKQSDAAWWMQVAINTANRVGNDAREAADLAGRFSHRLVVLEPLLRTVLAKFTEKGHPGEPCLRTGWIPERLVAEWRAVAGTYPDVPAPGRSGEEKP